MAHFLVFSVSMATASDESIAARVEQIIDDATEGGVLPPDARDELGTEGMESLAQGL